MLEKKAVKELYVMYRERVENYEEASKIEGLISYYDHIATYKKVLDSFHEWVSCIVINNFKIRFGIDIYTKDGIKIKERHNLSLKEKAYDDFENLCRMYFQNIIYYDIEVDNIIMRTHTNLTNHEACENCNGLKCDSCRKLYIVKDSVTGNVYYRGYDKQDAYNIYVINSKTYAEYFNDVLIYHNPDMEYFNDMKDRGYYGLICILIHEGILYNVK